MAKISVPILVLISVATLMSTAASLAGGLIMYYEGLKSLHDTVVETSKSELDSLRDHLQAPVDSAIQGFEALLYATYSPTFINSSDSSRWVEVIRQQMFSTVRVFPDELSLVLVGAPREPYSPSAFYTGVWSEPNDNGPRTYIHASYGEHLNDSHSVTNATATSPPLIKVPAHMWQMSGDDGSLGADTGTFDAGVYFNTLGTWDMERDGGWPDATWRTRNDPKTRILADKWMPPTIWITLGGGVHAFTAYAALFHPPPPPHPWSDYRIIMCQVELWYAMWQRRVMSFSEGKPDTTVVVFDRKRALVYATTTGDPLVNPACSDTANTIASRAHCLTHVRNMSLAIQEAIHHTGSTPHFDLQTASFDGEEYYALHAPSIIDNVEILWLRRTSTIKGKVQKALTYLIIFSVLVLAFDLLVSVAEVFFIAMPLKRLEFAIDQIGAMRTEAALDALGEYDNRIVAVSEMRSVFSGMLSTTKQLQEYKAFMPQSVLYSSEDEDSECETSDLRSLRSLSRVGGSTQGARSDSRGSLNGCVVYAKQKTESGNLTRRKRVTAAYCNLRGFLAALNSGSEVLAVHTAYVEEVVQHTRALHGVVDDLSGDRMSLSFNTVSVCNGHEQKGALLAMHVRAMKDAVAGMLDVSVAVCAAPALVGNVGCAALKKYSIFGTVLGDVRSLLAAGKAWSIAALCNDAVAKQAATSVVVRHVAPALVDGRKMLVSEMVEEVGAQAAEEWMYQVAQAESDNPHAVNNTILEQLFQGSITEAGKLMEGCTCPVVQTLYNRAVADAKLSWLDVGYVTPLPVRP
eukprot:Rhum_TRINITY_DN15476_c1_g1::Rhum_TRINITY_DN15476_c1_g1_i4::g.160082::m.160082